MYLPLILTLASVLPGGKWNMPPLNDHEASRLRERAVVLWMLDLSKVILKQIVSHL